MKDIIKKILREYINEVKVPKTERIELYRDENVIVVVPLTHNSLKKYANKCQWCINNDEYEWTNYHQGRSVVIIQRKPKLPKIGITGNPTASEILMYQRWGEGYTFDDIQDILGYEFESEKSADEYLGSLIYELENYMTNIVYYSSDHGIYDMEDNHMSDFGFELEDIPNITPDIINIIDNFNKTLNENNENIFSGTFVNKHIKSLTTDHNDLPDYFMKNIIKPKKFKIKEIDLLNLLQTDVSFKEYYEHGKNRYEDDEVHHDDLYSLIVVVDGELMDGYNRSSELLKNGITKTMGFVNIGDEVLNESVKGRKIKPNKYVFHKTNNLNRDDILRYGLIPSVGECYVDYNGGECIPAVFVTNSDNEDEWFDTTYDDDVWVIDTSNLKNNFFVDNNFKNLRHPEFGSYKHLVTFEEIPPTNLKLYYSGTSEPLYESSEYLNEQQMNNIVGWRVGGVELNTNSGGIWFAETKDGAEKFAKSVRNNNEEAKKYILNFKNPKYYPSFWGDYIWDVEREYSYDRSKLMDDLISHGYDGMFIDTDTWNDTGDKFSVKSKQYVVFNKSQIKYNHSGTGEGLYESSNLDVNTLDLYHGTCPENLDNLLKNGWLPRTTGVGGNMGQPKYLYVSSDPEDALWFSQEKGCNTVIKISNVPISYLKPDPEDESGFTMGELLFRIKNSNSPSKFVITQPIEKKYFSIFRF